MVDIKVSLYDYVKAEPRDGGTPPPSRREKERRATSPASLRSHGRKEESSLSFFPPLRPFAGEVARDAPSRRVTEGAQGRYNTFTA